MKVRVKHERRTSQNSSDIVTECGQDLAALRKFSILTSAILFSRAINVKRVVSSQRLRVEGLGAKSTRVDHLTVPRIGYSGGLVRINNPKCRLQDSVAGFDCRKACLKEVRTKSVAGDEKGESGHGYVFVCEAGTREPLFHTSK
jgi:hypothetical protein